MDKALEAARVEVVALEGRNDLHRRFQVGLLPLCPGDTLLDLLLCVADYSGP